MSVLYSYDDNTAYNIITLTILFTTMFSIAPPTILEVALNKNARLNNIKEKIIENTD